MKKTKSKIKYSWGNDFEFHIWDKVKGKMVSAIDVLKKDKYDPIDLGDGIKLYYDNILAEVAFPPYYSKDEMLKRFTTVFSRIQKHIGDRYELVPKASHVYDNEALNNPIALESGCSPNFNAYTVAPNPPTEFKGGLRSAGAHFHVGAKHLMDFDTRIKTIKLMDILVGIPAVIFDKDDTAKERRTLYGSASEHRATSFGLEYRPLSPGLLRSREATELTFDLINHTLKQIEDGKADEILKQVEPEIIQKTINTCDQKLALQVLNKVKMPKNLLKRIKKKYQFDFQKSWKLTHA